MRTKIPALVFSLFLSCPLVATEPKLVVFIGDSLSEGQGVSAEQAYPSLIGKYLESRGKKVTVLNASIGGSTSASAARRMEKALTKKPQMVVLALGANDALRGIKPTAMEANLGKAVSMAEKAKVTLMVAGIKIPSLYGPEYSKNFDKVFQSLSKKHKVFVVENLLEGVLGKTDLNQTDGLHPNPKGHEKIASSLAPLLEKML